MNHWPARAEPGRLPRGEHIVRYLGGHPEFAGVGPATARRLWDALGEDLYRILGNGDVDRLAELLPRTQAEIVCDAWRNQQAVADAVVFFDEHGIDCHLARKAIDLWGEQAVAKLRENPYRLLTICPWRRVDGVARLLGVATDDPRRLVGALEAALYERLDEKHTLTAREEVVTRAGRLLGAPREVAEAALAAAVEERAAIPHAAGGYQPAGAAYAERYIEARLRAALDAPVRQRDLLARDAPSAEVEAFLDLHDARAPHRLTGEQRAAVRMALGHRLAVLTGGAGVGKTTALRAINEAARRFGFEVHQLAVAGRAAQRMSAATGRPARTIASWLGQAARGQMETGARHLVVVDEASMLDLPTLYRLLFHLHEDARLLLVGDVAQLPPIGYGLTLHRLVQSPYIPSVELTRVLRADEATGIPLVSRAIREGLVPALPAYRAGLPGCSMVECGHGEIVGAVEQIRDDLRDEELQVVGSTYAGQAGIDAINTHFHRFNAHGRPRLGRFAVNDPVIWIRNDYERGLWNGSMGEVLAVDGEHLSVRLDGNELALHRDEFADRLELAYAVSTHKAQGSQWSTVVLTLTPSRLLDRALLYTAVTRAERRVVLVGSAEVLVRAVAEPPASLARDVALSV